MIPDEDAGQLPPLMSMPGSWQAGVLLGALTLILGLVVSFHPTGSLNVISVLLGILMIASGLFHLIRVFAVPDSNRIWLGITGLLYIVLGVVFIRHLHLTTAFIGLLIGLTFIIQGVTELVRGAAGGAREGRTWWIAFGVVSIIAGIFVTADPVSSLGALAVLAGIWFAIMGVFEILNGFLLWRAERAARAARAVEPQHA